jgi:uncharacterized OsmC-like protein
MIRHSPSAKSYHADKSPQRDLGRAAQTLLMCNQETVMSNQKMTFHVESVRLNANGSIARCKKAEIALDTDPAGTPDAFNPAELLLAALSACMIKGVERMIPILKFTLRGVEIRVDGVRQDLPPKMESIRYEIIVDTDESDHRLELLHDNVKKFGTVFNTVAMGTQLEGALRRKEK